jgi:hypothetical protein
MKRGVGVIFINNNNNNNNNRPKLILKCSTSFWFLFSWENQENYTFDAADFDTENFEMVCKIITQTYIKTRYEFQQKEATVEGSNTSVSNWCGARESLQEFKTSEFERSCPQRQRFEQVTFYSVICLQQ